MDLVMLSRQILRAPCTVRGQLQGLVPLKKPAATWTASETKDGAGECSLQRFGLSPEGLEKSGLTVFKTTFMPLDERTPREEDVLKRISQAYGVIRCGELEIGATMLAPLEKQLARDGSRFARRAEFYTKSGRNVCGGFYRPGIEKHLRKRQQKITYSAAAQHDSLSVANSQHDEALLAFVDFWMTPDSGTLKESIALANSSESIARDKCSGLDRRDVIFGIHNAIVSCIRFSARAGKAARNFVDDRQFKDLEEYTHELSDLHCKHDALRALADYYLAIRDYAKAEVCIADGIAIYFQLPSRSPYSQFDWLWLLMTYAIRTYKIGRFDEYDFAETYRSHWILYPQIYFHHQFAPLFRYLRRSENEWTDPTVRPLLAARIANTLRARLRL